MTVIFSSDGSRATAESLKESGRKLNTILSGDLKFAVDNARRIYQSESANELYALYHRMDEKFPELLSAINRCADYLENTVAPAYEKVEKKTADRVG